MPSTTITATTRFDRRLLGSSVTGRVVSVHRTAAIVRTDPRGQLLTLLPEAHWLVPLGIARGGEPIARRGDLVVLRDRTLRWGNRPSVALMGEGVDLGVATRPLSARLLREQLECVDASQTTASDGVVGAAVAESRLRLEGLVAAALGGESARSLERSVQSLVGLGPGSTPTGDDLLTGMAAAMYRFCAAGALDLGCLAALRASLRAVRPGATTPVSTEMLRHAAEGQFLEPLIRLVHSLGAGSPRDLGEAASALSAIGSHSGNDLAYGAVAIARATSGD